jgi:hypothetical protein
MLNSSLNSNFLSTSRFSRIEVSMMEKARRHLLENTIIYSLDRLNFQL